MKGGETQQGHDEEKEAIGCFDDGFHNGLIGD